MEVHGGIEGGKERGREGVVKEKLFLGGRGGGKVGGMGKGGMEGDRMRLIEREVSG